MSNRDHNFVMSSASTRWQPFGQLVGVPTAQFAETSSGGERQYGSGMRQRRHSGRRKARNSLSRIW